MWPFRRSPLVVELTRLLKFCDEWNESDGFWCHQPTKIAIWFKGGKKLLSINIGVDEWHHPHRYKSKIEPARSEKRTIFKAVKKSMKGKGHTEDLKIRNDLYWKLKGHKFDEKPPHMATDWLRMAYYFGGVALGGIVGWAILLWAGVHF